MQEMSKSMVFVEVISIHKGNHNAVLIDKKIVWKRKVLGMAANFNKGFMTHYLDESI